VCVIWGGGGYFGRGLFVEVGVGKFFGGLCVEGIWSLLGRGF